MYNIPLALLANPSISSATKLVFIFINAECKDTPQLSYDTIAAGTGLTRMSVIRCTKHLVDLDLISRVKDSKGWLMYSVNEVNAND